MECKRWRAGGRVTSSAGSRAAEQPGSRAAEQAAEQPEQPEQHNGQRAQSAAAVRWQRGGSGAAMHRQLGVVGVTARLVSVAVKDHDLDNHVTEGE